MSGAMSLSEYVTHAPDPVLTRPSDLGIVSLATASRLSKDRAVFCRAFEAHNSMAFDFKYDVFLSYSSNDKPALRELADKLRGDGLRVWLDDWEIRPGDMIGKRIEEGLESSRVLVLAMSSNALQSEWSQLESWMFRFRDPANKERRFIPLRLDDTEITDALKQFAYVDWRNKSEPEYKRLRDACRLTESPPPIEPTVSSSVLPPVKTISLGHTSWIRSVALSADGRHAISGSADNTVRLWDLDAGRCTATLEGHAHSVRGVALSADIRRAISGSNDKTVRVWDLVTGHCTATLEGHTDSVLGVALSADPRRAISGSDDHTVRLWDLETGRCIAALEGHTARVSGVALSADARRAISGSSDKTVRVWDLVTGRCTATLEGHTDSVSRVALSADDRRAISGSHDKTVRVWDLDTGRCIVTLEGHADSVRGVALSGDAHHAVSGSADKTVRVWDLDTGRCTATLEGHTASVLSVALSADARRAISGSSDKTVRVWDLDTGRCTVTVEGHTNSVRGVALSADAHRAISGSDDHAVRVWDLDTGRCAATLEGHRASVLGVALSADARRAISGSDDHTVRVWDLATGRCTATLEGHTARVWGVALNADARRAISGSSDKTVRVWDLDSGRCTATLEGHSVRVWGVALSADANSAISGSADNTVRVWDLETGRCTATLEGHTDSVWGVALSADAHRAISGSADKTVRVWDLDTGRCIATLEGHTARVRAVALSADARRAISGSDDNTVRVWDLVTGSCTATLEGHTARVMGVALSADARLALSGAINGVARLWSLEGSDLDALPALPEAAHYTNAKVLLVGESGVGKTALSIRLTENRFEAATVSTDAGEVRRADWATQLKLPAAEPADETEREIWLWDFAGQADYRLIQQLFMDETALAVLVFNPQSENPFEGLGQWERDLQRAARRPFRKLLVAGRVDRGGLMVSRDSVDLFLKERGFVDYIETSALQGTGCDGLRDAIISRIPWDEIPYTSSPRIFRLLKEEIVKLKDEGKVLLRMAELKQHLELRLPGESFTIETLRAVVGLLAGPGIVWQLEFGDFVLLQPERINAYAAAVVRSVRAHTEEIGSIAEGKVAAGELDYQDMKRLRREEEEVVLRAMHQTFVDHGLCLREHADSGTLLIFPSYFKRERPMLERHPLVLVTYQFNGPLDEIYATLVVRLYHTAAFERDKLWRFAADFKTPAGKRLGLKMIKKAEGAAELEVYFEQGVSDDLQVTFIRYVHEHLKLKAKDVVRLRHYVCPHCETPVEGRRAIEVRLSQGFKDMFCGACGKQVMLWDLIEEKFASEEFQRRVRELEERAKAAIDNESRELILIGHAFAIAGEAGQIYRQYTNSDHGIDGEIEFKNWHGKASGRRVYLQLKSGDSYLYKRKEDGAEIFTIKKPRHSEYWQQQAYPVMLVIRTSDGTIRWMDVSEYLKRQTKGNQPIKQVVFDGEALTALSLLKLREKVLGPPRL